MELYERLFTSEREKIELLIILIRKKQSTIYKYVHKIAKTQLHFCNLVYFRMNSCF